jgi:hypothetical protein
MKVGAVPFPFTIILSAHVAYMLALYRHRPDVISALKNMVKDYTENIKSSYGFIGANQNFKLQYHFKC